MTWAQLEWLKESGWIKVQTIFWLFKYYNVKSTTEQEHSQRNLHHKQGLRTNSNAKDDMLGR